MNERLIETARTVGTWLERALAAAILVGVVVHWLCERDGSGRYGLAQYRDVL